MVNVTICDPWRCTSKYSTLILAAKRPWYQFSTNKNWIVNHYVWTGLMDCMDLIDFDWICTDLYIYIYRYWYMYISTYMYGCILLFPKVWLTTHVLTPDQPWFCLSSASIRCAGENSRSSAVCSSELRATGLVILLGELSWLCCWCFQVEDGRNFSSYNKLRADWYQYVSIVSSHG